MPDKSSNKIKRPTHIKPTKAHKRLQAGSERPEVAPKGTNGVKGPPRNKG
jgi:hypothetical protein